MNISSRLAWALAGALLLAPSAARATEETLTLGRLGKVTLYYNSPHPSQVVLFVSGDGGWNLGVVDMARELASLDAVVAGVNIVTYLKALEASPGACSYPAADFEMLSKAVQQHLDYPRYVTPILVGYSSGATLVYAMLVQAPSNTFAGALSLGFCPDLLIHKPFCKGEGLEWDPGPKGKGVIFRPATNLQRPWIAFQGTIDQVCDPPSTEKYVGQVKNGEVVMLPKVGHGYSVPRNWMPQFKTAFASLAARNLPAVTPRADELQDLPLEEFPAAATADTTGGLMALHLSGDGGYGVTDRGISEMLAADGIPVAGLNSLHYFWKRKTPDETARDVARVLQHYLAVWHKERAILVGYSFGADVIPFVMTRLPADLAARVSVIALIGPDPDAEFEFHVSDWFSNRPSAEALPTLPELKKVHGPKILCFRGKEEHDSLCPDCPSGLVTEVVLEGGHRVHGRYQPVADAILKAAHGGEPQPGS